MTNVVDRLSLMSQSLNDTVIVFLLIIIEWVMGEWSESKIQYSYRMINDLFYISV